MPYKDKDKQREYQRKWWQERRNAWLEGKDCVQKDDTCEGKLEIDHVNPHIKISSRIWSWCAARRLIELAKCQVLCHSHHLRKTIKDLDELRKHGTASAYLRYHCRCDECMAFKKKYPDELRSYIENCGSRALDKELATV